MARRPLHDLFELLLSCGYLLMLSLILSGLGSIPLWLSLLLVLIAAAAVFVTGLLLAVSWAERHQEPRRQVSLGMLLFLTFLAALYFSLLRLMVSDVGTPTLGRWIAAFVYGGVLLVLAFPSVLIVGSSLLRFAAWLVHRPWLQAGLRRWARRGRADRARGPDPPI